MCLHVLRRCCFGECCPLASRVHRRPVRSGTAVTRFATAVLASVMPWIVGCGEEETGGGPPGSGPAQVDAARPLVMPIVQWDDYTGRLDAIESVEIRSRVSGYLQSLHFGEGQLVQAGDLLAIIDPRPFEAARTAALAGRKEAEAGLKQAQAQLEEAEAQQNDRVAQFRLAQTRLRRAEELQRGNAIAAEEFDIRESEVVQAAAAVEAAEATVQSANAGIATAEAAIATADAELATADLNLDYTRIEAPISGRISRREVTQGNLVTGGTETGTLLTTIVSLNPIHVYFDANEREFLKYVRLSREGKRESSREAKNPVYVALVDEQGFPHQGHMDFVDNRVDPNTGTMRGRAILGNDDGLLTPGLFVEVRLPGSGRYAAVMIPDAAIVSDQSEKFVYVVTGPPPSGDGSGDGADSGASDGSGGGEGETDAGPPPTNLRRQPVVLGEISHGLRVIDDGLRGDETIVVGGLSRIRPGVSVEPTMVKIEAESSPLPDEYTPVPKEQWLRSPVDPPPSPLPADAATTNAGSVAGPRGDRA